MQSRT